MVSQTVGRTLLLLAALHRVAAQIKVLAPSSLKQQFSSTRGHISGSTSTFGAPFYGDRVLGRVIWGESNGENHCTDSDYHIPRTQTKGALIKIVLVRRGNCSFTKKVRVAYKKGAHAVIIVDKEDSVLTSEDMNRIIVADDGYGDKIRIPSILIAKDEGNKLIEAAKTSFRVVVELAWEIPTDQVVQVDLWMSTASRASQQFLKEFAPLRRALNKVLRFRPHYSIFGIKSKDYNDLCSSPDGEYCAEDPDASGVVTGRDVLQEDIRQLCIHEITKVPRTSLKDLAAGKKMVFYSAPFWDYVERFGDTCKLDAKDIKDRFGKACSEGLMRSIGIDIAKVQDCMITSMDEKMKYQKENPAWSPRALRINGWRYSGLLSADLVMRAICSGFTKKPSECKDLLKPRDPTVRYEMVPASGGVSFGTFIVALLIIGALMAAALMLYKRSVQANMHSTVREEVMLEVQAQMSAYTKMTADF